MLATTRPRRGSGGVSLCKAGPRTERRLSLLRSYVGLHSTPNDSVARGSRAPDSLLDYSLPRSAAFGAVFIVAIICTVWAIRFLWRRAPVGLVSQPPLASRGGEAGTGQPASHLAPVQRAPSGAAVAAADQRHERHGHGTPDPSLAPLPCRGPSPDGATVTSVTCLNRFRPPPPPMVSWIDVLRGAVTVLWLGFVLAMAVTLPTDAAPGSVAAIIAWVARRKVLCFYVAASVMAVVQAAEVVRYRLTVSSPTPQTEAGAIFLTLGALTAVGAVVAGLVCAVFSSDLRMGADDAAAGITALADGTMDMAGWLASLSETPPPSSAPPTGRWWCRRALQRVAAVAAAAADSALHPERLAADLEGGQEARRVILRALAEQQSGNGVVDEDAVRQRLRAF